MASTHLSSSTDLSVASYRCVRFAEAVSFKGNIKDWDTSSVTDMSNMFLSATAFSGSVSDFNTSSVENMHSMFYRAKSFNGQLRDWDVSQVRDFSYMFYKCEAFNMDLHTWAVTRAQKMNSMFEGASSFNKDLCIWANKIEYKAKLDATNMFAGSGCDIVADPDFGDDGVTGSFCDDCITSATRRLKNAEV
jgi:surface protein